MEKGLAFQAIVKISLFSFTYLKGPNLQSVKESIDLSNIVLCHTNYIVT